MDDEQDDPIEQRQQQRKIPKIPDPTRVSTRQVIPLPTREPDKRKEEDQRERP